MKTRATMVLIFSILGLMISASAGQPESGGGPSIYGNCVPNQIYQVLLDKVTKAKISGFRQSPLVPLFLDPMGNGGTNSLAKPIVNYVDLDSSSGRLDFHCDNITYDGHNGTDILILDFYEMDEGVPVLCAAAGEIVNKQDGEFDRNLSGPPESGNYLVIRHLDGSFALYFHFRKNSITVDLWDTVQAGDTLGLVGSSGQSSWPHIHFEARDSNFAVVDPFTGLCQPNPSSWQSQPAYIIDLPFELEHHGLTTIPTSVSVVAERPPTKTHVTAGKTVYAWVRVSTFKSGQVLKWEFYANNSLWSTQSITADIHYADSRWFISKILPSDPSFFGNWIVKIYHNNNLVAEDSFVLNNQANQLPTVPEQAVLVPSLDPVQGEFTATDPDGSIFWYKILTPASHGTLTQDGGRKRKFTYTPDGSFTDFDLVQFYAVDDENDTGSSGTLILYSQCLKPGDANASSDYSLADVISIVNYIFNKPGCVTLPLCWLSNLRCRGDWDGSTTVSLGDVIRAVNFIFNKPGGPWNALPSGVCCL